MNSPKRIASLEPHTLSGLAQYLDHNLNCHVDADGRKRILNGPEIGLLVQLDRLIRLALETSFAPFVIRHGVRPGWVTERDAYGRTRNVGLGSYGRKAGVNSFYPVTQDLAGLLTRIRGSSTILDASNEAARQLVHAPHIRLLLDVFFQHPICCCLGSSIDTPADDGRLLAEVYNDFIAQFRQVMVSRKLLRREMHNWNLGSFENVANLSSYLDHLCAKHGSLTVLHLRLFHAKDRASLITAPVEEQHRDLKALRACRAKFFDRMRRKPALFTDDPGYVWAILPSLEGGYDLHLTLLFSTVALRRVLDDKKVEAEQLGVALQDHADWIGAYWVQMATGGQGSYLRGDANAVLYGPDWVHGEVDDHTRFGKLKETLGHLAMRRALVRLKNEPPGQYFHMPDLEPRSTPRPARGDWKPG